MKYFYLSLLICFLGASELKGQNLTEAIAQRFCQELGNPDTLKLNSFESLLPEIEKKVLLNNTELIMTISNEISQRNISYLEFYTEVYNTFSKTCPAYQAIFRDHDFKLKDPEYFVNSYCGCFNEVTGGKIDNEDMGSVLKECNQKFDKDKSYKKKVRQEMKNKQLTEAAFSNIITANFLTQCDLIVNHFFSFRANLLAINSHMIVSDHRKQER